MKHQKMTKLMICNRCDIEFNIQEKVSRAKANKISAGKYNECLDCASPDKEPVYTGVMISGTKTASAIQINRDPELTKYMLRSSPSAGSRVAMVQTKPKSKAGSVAVFVKEIAKRRE